MMETEVKVIREASQNIELFEAALNNHLSCGWKLRSNLVACGNHLHQMIYKETYIEVPRDN